jgi:hypothetical protein
MRLILYLGPKVSIRTQKAEGAEKAEARVSCVTFGFQGVDHDASRLE